jgi:hypothetical protein
MPDTRLIDNLKAFNRKERYYLIGTALGNKEFRLCEDFIQQLRASVASAEIDFSDCRFVAMDYHLDWIYASLVLSAQGLSAEDAASLGTTWTRGKDNKLISATQEDIDLIAVFGSATNSAWNHVLLIEAKGVGSWDTHQLKSKGKRLAAILGDRDLLERVCVVPHFVYGAPVRPRAAHIKDLPQLMSQQGNPPYIRLRLPASLAKVTQCDGGGEARVSGSKWKELLHS